MLGASSPSGSSRTNRLAPGAASAACAESQLVVASNGAGLTDRLALLVHPFPSLEAVVERPKFFPRIFRSSVFVVCALARSRQSCPATARAFFLGAADHT